MRRWAFAGLLIVLTGCSEPSRVLLPDIPMPPGVTASAVDKPGDWTSLTPEQALTIARAGGGPTVGANPVRDAPTELNGSLLEISEVLRTTEDVLEHRRCAPTPDAGP